MKYHLEFDIEFKKNEYPGRFIAFEGIDASGKSTQVGLVAEKLKARGRVVSIRNPFEGEIGKFIRQILSGEKPLPAVTLQYLISANRHAQQLEIIEDLKKGHDVIIDRYIWSAVAYGIMDKGSYDFEKTATWLLVEQSVLSMYHQFLMPDQTFYLDISAEEAIGRLSKMEKTKEIYEDAGKIRKIVSIYQYLVKTYADQFVVIDGEQSVESVTEAIVKHIVLP